MADNNKQLTIGQFMTNPGIQAKMQSMFTDKSLMDGFIQSVISIAGSDDLLAKAEPRSVFNACMTAASLKLPINKNLGFAHIIGYNNNKKGIVEAQFQLGARGFKELAQRTGLYKVINQGDVREGELIGRNRLTGELEFKWEEDDEKREKLPIVGYFSYFRLTTGQESTVYMSKEQVNNHAKKFSQSYKLDVQKGWTSSPWSKDFDAMALKTVSKQNISKNGPLSVELQKAVVVDQAIIHDENNMDYADGRDDLSDVKATDEGKSAIIDANADDVAEVSDADLENPGALFDAEDTISVDKSKANPGTDGAKRKAGK